MCLLRTKYEKDYLFFELCNPGEFLSRGDMGYEI
jgi:hypothetical protein